MRTLFGIVAFLAFVGTSTLASASQQWTVKETLPDGRVDVRVIQETSAPRNRQDLLPQIVIFKRVMSAGEAAEFKAPLVNRIYAAQSGKPLWPLSKPQWTQADEDDYSKWIATDVTTDFLADTNLVVDCADAGLLFRWVYARNHQLPIANSLTGSGQLFGHFSSNADWDKLAQDPDWKKDERFKAALRYLFDNSFTRTVVADLYPTFVSPQYVRPGSMFMIIRTSSGHTQTVHKVDLNHGISTFWGNEPAAEEIFESPLIVEAQSKQTIGMWRWARQDSTSKGMRWVLTPPEEMPGYSLEQFQETTDDSDAFSDWLYQKLGITISDADKLASVVKSFEQSLMMRENITAMSIAYCYLSPCDPSSQQYSDYSTFARDARIVSEQNEALALIAKLGNADPGVTAAIAELPDAELIPGSGLTYKGLLKDTAAVARFNPDPRVSFPERWGLTGAQITPTIELNSYGVAMEEYFFQRMYIVFAALNSTDLDKAVRLVLPKTMEASKASGVDADAFGKIRQVFQSQKLSLTGEDCGHPGTGCTLDDVAFTDDAQKRLPNWSSVATDPAPKRWGF